MSELANVGAKFGPGYDQAEESVDISKRPDSDATAKWDPGKILEPIFIHM